MNNRLFYILILCFVQVNSLMGQREVKPAFVNQYEKIIQSYPEIHTGTQYIETRRSLDGHPYYADAQMEKGSLSIDGFVFNNLPLQYEIWDDLVLSFSDSFKQKMILNHAKIDRFVLSEGSVFVKKPQPEGYSFHKSGFYREIENGIIGLYCKHRKQRKQETSTAELIRSYEEVEKFFVEIKEQMLPVPAKRKVFALLGIDKKIAKKQLRKEGLRFRKHKEAYLQALVTLANQKENND